MPSSTHRAGCGGVRGRHSKVCQKYRGNVGKYEQEWTSCTECSRRRLEFIYDAFFPSQNALNVPLQSEKAIWEFWNGTSCVVTKSDGGVPSIRDSYFSKDEYSCDNLSRSRQKALMHDLGDQAVGMITKDMDESHATAFHFRSDEPAHKTRPFHGRQPGFLSPQCGQKQSQRQQ